MSGDGSGLDVNGPDTLGGALALLLVGLAIAGYGAYDYSQQSSALEDAVEVDATITEVSVESQSTSSTSGVDYEPRVRYTYEFEGTSYDGTKLYPATTAPEYDTESAAREAIAEYETGETVTAYVVPSDPRDSFLRAQTSNTPLALAGIGGVLSLFGGWTSLQRYRER